MKKLFTMLGAALMMGSFAANAAENITAYVGYYDSNGNWVDAMPFDTKLTKNQDGTLSIKNFVDSGSAFTFSFDEEVAADESTVIDACNLFQPDIAGYWPYLMTSSDYQLGEDGWPADWNDYMTLKYYDTEESEATYFWYPVIYNTVSNSYIYRYDLTEYPDYKEYYACIALGGTLDDNSWGYLYVYFYFDMPEVEEPVEEVVVYICDTSYNYYQNSETGFVKNEDGSYTMTDFLNSGYPVSFTFDVPEAEGEDAAITFVGNIDRTENYYVEFLTPDDEDMSCIVYASGSKKGTTWWYPTAYEGIDYCYVEKLTEEEVEYYGLGEYYCMITMYGILSSGSRTGWHYVFFYFDLPSDISTGVNAMEEDNDAPIEYYNLNGVKVTNPSAGIYVRKQGSNVKKVVIK